LRHHDAHEKQGEPDNAKDGIRENREDRTDGAGARLGLAHIKMQPGEVEKTDWDFAEHKRQGASDAVVEEDAVHEDNGHDMMEPHAPRVRQNSCLAVAGVERDALCEIEAKEGGGEGACPFELGPSDPIKTVRQGVERGDEGVQEPHHFDRHLVAAFGSTPFFREIRGHHSREDHHAYMKIQN